ncbi:MAG: hypothetical protein MUC87_12420 [Bacteroidia bacterium]|jgi:hypothetical protein|nr:hypothetical protein [Bacteroidia bacterium]
MKRIVVFIFLLALAAPSFAQQKYGGVFSLGIRTTSSLFTQAGSPGMGVGGQFRLRMLRLVNTEWFADYINTDIDGIGHRTDAHIGWSVMFYLREPEVFTSSPGDAANAPKQITYHRFTPYLLAGHCFDYTWIRSATIPVYTEAKRWSSAVQAGAGVHFHLGARTDLSCSAQYMMHLGDDVHAHVKEVNGVKTLEIEQHQGFSPEGHLLLTLSANFRIADLW